MYRTRIGLSLVIVLAGGVAQGAELSPKAKELVGAYEEQVKPVNAKYDAELEELDAERAAKTKAEQEELVDRLKSVLEKVQSSGRLDAANAVRGAVDSLRDAIDKGEPTPELGDLPPEAARETFPFTKASAKIDAEHSKRVEKLEAKRAKELSKDTKALVKKLKKEIKALVKKGDLEAANAVKAKIASLGAGGGQRYLDPRRWEVATWANEWELQPVTKMKVAKKDGVLSAINTTGVHSHAMFLCQDKWAGEFRVAVEFKGTAFFTGLRVASRSRGTLSHTLDTTLSEWTTLVIERVGGALKVTLGGKPITLKAYEGAKPADTLQFGFSLRKDQTIEIRRFEVQAR